MRQEKTICDHCEKDISYTSNVTDWRINVRSEAIPTKGGIVTAMNLPPPIDPQLHFCSLKCFATWADSSLTHYRFNKE